MFKNKNKESLKKILEESRKFGFHEQDYLNALELIENGEYKIAIELICDQLYENDIKIPSGLFSQIELKCIELNITRKRFEFLKEIIKS